jgi:rare lipoprotein A
VLVLGPASIVGANETGLASWYGGKHHGRPTASGATFDQDSLTAAHRSLPFGSRVEVTNLRNGRRVEVEVNDRGPFVKRRIVDLSRGAARKIGAIGHGVVPVRLRVLSTPPGRAR